jgi:hypothetical protein
MPNKCMVRRYVWQDKDMKYVTNKNGETYPLPRPASDWKYHYVKKEDLK